MTVEDNNRKELKKLNKQLLLKVQLRGQKHQIRESLTRNIRSENEKREEKKEVTNIANWTTTILLAASVVP